MTRRNVFFILLVGGLLTLGGCLALEPSKSTAGTSSSDGKITRELNQFYTELQNPDLTPEELAVVIDQIAKYTQLESHAKMVSFLNNRVSNYPDDPYNAYYLWRIADSFEDRGNSQSAYQMYYRILRNYPDVIWQNQSVHFVSLLRAINLDQDTRLTAEFLQQLIHRFPDSVDLGARYLQLAQALEAIGEYPRAYDAYEKFLTFEDTVIPGKPGIHYLIREKVAFYHSSKTWIDRDLDALVRNIKNALYYKNGWSLLRYQAKVNFFAMTWYQERQDFNARPDFELIEFLSQAKRITYASELEFASHGNEAYLRTGGWSPRIPTWFLYFRKIDYPADPQVHGSWEWAGIYFGEAI